MPHFLGARPEKQATPRGRLEDHGLLRGEGTFVDDIRLDGMLHAAVLRSPVAHARLMRVDVTPALGYPGIVAAAAFGDLPQPVPALPNLRPHPQLRARTAYPLAKDKVRYVGEPIAVVVATSRYQAEDALERVDVEYEALPWVGDLRQAAEGAPALVHDDLGSNLAAHVIQEVGHAEPSLHMAEHTLTRTFRISRSTGQAMETRGVVAVFDPVAEALTVWASCQRPHQNRTHIAAMLGIPEGRVRVIAPNVGGGFGPKGRFYAEDFLIPYLAYALRRPVKWIEDRREHLLTTTHEREQIHEVTVAFQGDGTILALKDRFLHDMGAYVSAGLVVPFNTMCTLPGPYHVPNLSVQAICAYTNRVTTSPVRGAGQPEATFVMEHVIDAIADRLDRDPADIRRRNLIPPHAFPYSVGLNDLDGRPVVYDSGNFPLCLEKALDAIDYLSVRAEQHDLWRRAVYRGVGLACYVEMTGVGPQEEARVSLNADGRVTLFVGCGSQGQGHRTILAQLCAWELGLRADDVAVVEGDTGQVESSMGTYGSRTTVVAGTAVVMAARQLRDRLLQAAATRLQVAVEQLALASGRFCLKDAPSTSVSLAELVPTLAPDHGGTGAKSPPAEVHGSAVFSPARPTTSSGVHAALVDVQADSGEVKIVQYVIVHDCGRMINPRLVEGQIHGGLAHGVGESLYEHLVYDEDGQLLTTTLGDYLLPTSTEVPEVMIEHVETPSPLNALGAKGVGEGGVIPVSAALSLAVQDALAPMEVTVDSAPLKPEALWQALRRSRQASHPVAGGMEAQ